jgi:hypothetical protein
MLRLRVPVCATATVWAVAVWTVGGAALAAAGAGVHLSAICAMKLPRATKTAQKIIKLRMIILDTRQSKKWTADNTTAPANPRLTTTAKAAILAKRMSEVLTRSFNLAPLAGRGRNSQ